MLSIEQNLALLERIVEEFEAYILSAEIFWPLNHRGIRSTPLPRLTLGGMLLTLDELAAQKLHMTSKQSMQHERSLRRLEGIRKKWRGAVENKAIKELRARVNMWRAYLQDLKDQPEWIENYPQEVRIRVMIDHLATIIEPNPALETECQAIKNIDQRMQKYITSGEFVWEDVLQPLYPQDRYPYLYVKPRDSIDS